MFRITKHGFDLQAMLLMCWINHLEHHHAAQEPV